MHFQTPDDVRTIIRNASRIGVDTVFWQVRGNGTVTYPSRIEPWSREFGYRDPGFDPLALALREAHRRGIRLEAWVNLMPAWRGSKPPPIRNQLYHTRPEWFLHDDAGQRQPLGRGYAILNPCLPAVRTYLVELCAEIATRYDIDGIHLDYVRYAWETTPNARERYPRDAETLRRYRAETGLHPDDQPARWDRWRADQLTELVAQIRGMLKRLRPDATLTAATWGNPNDGEKLFFQQARTWLRRGLLDAATPMTYTADAAKFARDIRAYRDPVPNAHLLPGIGLYKHTSLPSLALQFEQCARWDGRYALFSYASIYATAADRANPATDMPLRRMRRDAVRQAGQTR